MNRDDGKPLVKISANWEGDGSSHVQSGYLSQYASYADAGLAGGHVDNTNIVTIDNCSALHWSMELSMKLLDPT